MDPAPRLILAPLRGFTDHIYRNAFHRHFEGFDSALAPFISAFSAARCKPVHVKDLLPENNHGIAVMPQIMTNRPADFLTMARMLEDMGYGIINWNLGCPFPMVAKKKRGCGLLPHPKMIDAFLSDVCHKMPGRLSIKLRLGRYDTTEIMRLIPILNGYPLYEIIIHPRTGKQMYSGQPDLDAFERCLEVIDHPIVYNGDIINSQGFGALSDRFGDKVNGWMIGRGVIIDPFLPASIKSGCDVHRDKVASFKRFYDDLFEGYGQALQGPGHLLDRMKGFWKYFSKAFVDGRRIEKKVHRSQGLDQYLKIVERFFETDARWGL